jgi:predicted ATPase
MISKIRIKNFYSIGKEMELSFIKGGMVSENGYYQFKKNEKVSLINGFFGSNASGKSNALKAFTTIIRLIFSPVIGETLLVNQNMHNEFKDESTKLGADFIFNDKYYKYDIEIKAPSTILEEKLYMIDLKKKGAKPKEIFTRKNDSIRFGREYKNYKKYISIITIEKFQTLISYLISINTNAMTDFKEYKKNFSRIDQLEDMIPLPLIAYFRIRNISDGNEEKEFIEYTHKMMNFFDKSIDGIEISKNNSDKPVKVFHKDFSEGIDIIKESAGTRELFCYIYDIISTIKKGGVIIYDETNRYLHPEIENTILSLFQDKTLNKHNAQIFFASHNHDTMDLLELDQINIVEKGDNGHSEIYKASEIEGIKSRDSIKKKYRLGMLGGSPDKDGFEYKLKQLL